MAHRVIVVGAGIAGLSTAVALHRGGHLVTVFEERSDTSSGAGISIWPNALAALDRIGLGDQVREAGGRISAGAVRWLEKAVAADANALEASAQLVNLKLSLLRRAYLRRE